MNDGGKGSAARPFSVSQTQFGNNWDTIFGKKKPVYSWLPHKQFYEFAYHKHFNPDVEYTNWQPWDQWDYPERDILRFTHLIKNQRPYIVNRKVIDIGCHLGYLSLFCLHNQATHVTGTNVRSSELDIAREICHRAGYKNFDFLLSDINNHNELTELCSQYDTALISGVIYHVNNHYAVLQALADSGVETIVLDSRLDQELLSNPNAIIKWQWEDSEQSVNGYYRNKPKVFVGAPNVPWFEQAFNDLEYNIVYNKIIKYIKPDGDSTIRCIITAQKASK